MGQMMGSAGGLGIPVLLGVLLVLAIIAVGMAVARASRVVDRGTERRDRAIEAKTRPPDAHDNQVHTLRERYARGEIGHEEFLRDLDAAVRAELREGPGTTSRPSYAASGGEPVGQDPRQRTH